MRPLIAFVLAISLIASTQAGEPGKRETPKETPRFTVGKDTTFATEPLDKEGYVDYQAALNQRLSKGVTAENNANVLLWQALGPHPEGTKMPPEFFKWLGIKAPPAKGDYFIELSRFLHETDKGKAPIDRDAVFDQLTEAAAGPWSAEKFPQLAKWLAANEKPLALVVKATKRPEYFSPLVSHRTATNPGSLLEALMPGVQMCRQLGCALVSRAMLRLEAGRDDEAWQDLLATHRLARLSGRGGSLIEGLVSVAIESIAAEADVVFLERAKLDVKRIKACLRDLQALPPLPHMADKVDFCERFWFLEIVLNTDRFGLDYLEGLSGAKGPRKLTPRPMRNVHWDLALANANQWYDRMSAAMREKDYGQKTKTLEAMDIERRELRVKVPELGSLEHFRFWITATPEARGKRVGDMLLGLLTPAVVKVQQAGDRVQQIERNLHLACALAAHHREHGEYPAKLDALSPKYLKTIPEDLFTGKPLIYQPSATGYLLYSFGPNGEDDEGRYFDDEPPGDDPRVRVVGKKRK